MCARKAPLRGEFKDAKQIFLEQFAMEAKAVRDSIVNDLPAYNDILSIHAESFEEVALRIEAEKRNIYYTKYAPPVPTCPFCECVEHVRKKEEKKYICTACNKTFAANYKSISSNTKVSSLVYMKVLRCLLACYGQTRTCDYCNINANTYFNIRNRLFYCMKLLLENACIRLYGEVQVDNTYVSTSYRGMNLTYYDEAEDSVFFEEDKSIKPRPARDRGGPHSNKTKNQNHITIFCAIDDRGHALTRFVGIGAIAHTALLNYVPADHFLLTVPETDPFERFKKPASCEPKTKPGDLSLMVSDREGAIKKYAEKIGIEFESHVYRKNNVQRKLPASAHNIQRVNALHSRLKNFFRNHNYPSSRFLPGYLTLFEFQENTGASQEAIEELFKILATPGLGKPPAFFDSLFTVPNYLIEWLKDENPLRKLPPSKVLAFYLYDQYRHKEEYPDEDIPSMADIESETGYVAATIRKNYKDLVNAGYRAAILEHFNQEKKKSGRKQSGEQREKRKTILSPKTFNPVVLAIYDGFVENLKRPKDEVLMLAEYLELKNKEFGTEFKPSNMRMKFREIERKGVRPMGAAAVGDKRKHHWNVSDDHYIDVANEYDAILLSYRQKGEAPPHRFIICEEIGKRYGLSSSTIDRHIITGRKLKNKRNREKDAGQ